MSTAVDIDSYRVVAYTHDGRYVTHTNLCGLSWERAQRKWASLDNARLRGRLPLVQHLVVRASDDPDQRYQDRWANRPSFGGQCERDLAPFVVGRQRGFSGTYDGRGGAAKAWGNHHGYIGQPGGWIYKRLPDGGVGAPVTQGWLSSQFTKHTVAYGDRCYWDDLDLIGLGGDGQ